VRIKRPSKATWQICTPVLGAGDRIIICSQADREASAAWLAQHGWQRRDDWLPAPERARLEAALARLRTDPDNVRERSMLSTHLTLFEMPVVLVIYERASLSQRPADEPQRPEPAGGSAGGPGRSETAATEQADGAVRSHEETRDDP